MLVSVSRLQVTVDDTSATRSVIVEQLRREVVVVPVDGVRPGVGPGIGGGRTATSGLEVR